MSRVSHLIPRYLAFLCWLCIGSFLLTVIPHALYRYDIDPTDGDFLNAVERVRSFLPIYPDWREGSLPLLYAPLFALLLAPVKFLGIDTVLFARVFNVAAILTCIGILWYFVRQMRVSTSKVLIPLALAIVLLRIDLFWWCVNVRTDSLAMLVVCLATFVYVRWPEKAGYVGALCAFAVFSKQTMLVAGVSFFLYYAFFERQRLARFLLGGILATIVFVPAMEIYNHGQFLLTMFVYPAKTFQGPSQSWKNAWDTFNLLHRTPYLSLIFAMVGSVLLFLRKDRFRFFALFFWCDLLFYLKFGKNGGASISYLWPHWILAALMFATLLDTILRRLEKTGQIEKQWPKVILALLALSLTHSVGVYAQESWQDFTEARAKYREQNIAMEKHVEEIRAIVESDPTANWYTTRISMPVVRNGIILDNESGTLEFALDGGRFLDPAVYTRRFLKGDYKYVQRFQPWDTSPEIRRALDACYQKIKELPTNERGRSITVQILKLDQSQEPCKKMQSEFGIPN